MDTFQHGMSRATIAALEKAAVRKAVRTRLRAVTSGQRAEWSAQAAARLARQEAWQRAGCILGYLALPDELDLLPALQAARQAGKIVALPRYVPETGVYCAATLPGDLRELAEGAFGVAEPPAASLVIPLNRLDFVLAPGLAFDLSGQRLGRGKGFYDRLLAEVTGIKCGVALDEQIVAALPAEPHDIAMNFILTPTRWLAASTAGA